MEEDNEELRSFKDLGVCEQLVEACDSLGWKNPSKIQALVLPHALEGSVPLMICFFSCSIYLYAVYRFF